MRLHRGVRQKTKTEKGLTLGRVMPAILCQHGFRVFQELEVVFMGELSKQNSFLINEYILLLLK